MTEAYPRPPSVPGPERHALAFPGEPAQVPGARAFVACALAGCPARDALLTCVSELAANAITHTASGSGGVFTVEVVRPGPGVARVAVIDSGGPREPVIRRAREQAGLPGAEGGLADGGPDEGGRGLALVEAFSSRWGYHDAEGEGGGRVVWAEATWPVPVLALR